jgi:DNA modification methylase
MNINILQGDCIETLQKLDDKSINTCITSPPYWGLRNYNDEEKQLGMEDTPEEFVDNLVKVFREVKRVLRDDGTVWLNLGDSYARTGGDSSKKGRHWDDRKNNPNTGHNRYAKDIGLKPKDLVGIPWRVALALQQDGWYLRQDIIWHKPNPMPESVKDRCTKAHEYIFLLSKNVKYYFDNEAIKEDAKFPEGPNSAHSIRKGSDDPKMRTRIGLNRIGANPKRNKRSVWTITTKPFKGAHFATFPMDLIEPCVLAGCPEKICVDCNTPYVRQVESKRFKRNELPKDDPRYRPNTYEGSYKDINGKADAGYTETKDLGLQKQCDCETNETKAGTVLDPFGGSGTTGIVAVNHNRHAVLCELNQEYIDLAKKRIEEQAGFLATINITK